ncbi:ABC transporter ATP-binding protein [Xylophilus sp.]|uniref:ABC transporter ATP-binding protein n=1 Tax=Xylophilus sp. TaxID=2653893 RepID=UPI0013BE55B9|nr:ABC transporter ATP-binding protein [Xylophilus sp.]KAF1049547.1 MAG: Aliphatic sulfonates import ATP-binding protein SsuB [Xylophilus sp.]
MSAHLPSRQPLLEAVVRRKAFGGRAVLQDLQLALAPGEIVSLVGASGCGKSTLLRIVAGLDTDYDGAVRLAGRPQHDITREIGFIFQELRLFPWLTVAENVAFDLGRAGRHHPQVRELLAEVGLAGFEDRLPKQLSGGQAQRVAIARGLFTWPRVLLLDEPFSAVDAFTRIKLQDLLAGIARRHGITLLLVTHDVDEAVVLSDRVLVLEARAGAPLREIAVPLPRPRDREGDALGHLRVRILEALRHAHAV